MGNEPERRPDGRNVRELVRVRHCRRGAGLLVSDVSRIRPDAITTASPRCMRYRSTTPGICWSPTARLAAGRRHIRLRNTHPAERARSRRSPAAAHAARRRSCAFRSRLQRIRRTTSSSATVRAGRRTKISRSSWRLRTPATARSSSTALAISQSEMLIDGIDDIIMSDTDTVQLSAPPYSSMTAVPSRPHEYDKHRHVPGVRTVTLSPQAVFPSG